MSYLNERKYYSHVTTYFKDDPTKIAVIRYLDECGHLHRDPDDGPAMVSYGREGNLWSKRYMWRGHFHREDGPAYLEYLDDGTLFKEIWYRYGRRHRNLADGPAFRCHDETGSGQIISIQYWIHGYLFQDPRIGPVTTAYAKGEIDYVRFSNYVPPRPQPSKRWLRSKFGKYPEL